MRYTGIENSFEPLVYEGFAKFFNYGHYQSCSTSVSLKSHLKNILITQCVEKEMRTSAFELADEELLSNENSSPETGFQYLSEKEFIDILRSIPFPLRAVYNMAVIDRFTYADISEMLDIPEELVQPYLLLCRQQLKEMVTEAARRKKNNRVKNDINSEQDQRLWQE